MNSRSATIFLIFSITFSILISSTLAHLVMAQSENKTSLDDKNNTRRIINLVNNTITVVDKTTNETISTMPYEAGNTTTNNTTRDGGFPANAENTTTNINLTEKFNALSK